MKSEIILLSVKPKWAELIISGEKTVELRKSNFPDHVKKIVIYATKPVGEIVGIVEVSGIVKSSSCQFSWSGNTIYQSAKVSYQEFWKYYNNPYDRIVRVFLKNPQAIRMPLGEIVPKAPQSFLYLTEQQFKEICNHGK